MKRKKKRKRQRQGQTRIRLYRLDIRFFYLMFYVSELNEIIKSKSMLQRIYLFRRFCYKYY